MIDGANIFTHTNCWVYILQQKQAPKALRIAFAMTAKEMLHQTSPAELLYYRQFTQVSEAMGHKLLLENLSADSLYSCIQHLNPLMRDLNEEFRESR